MSASPIVALLCHPATPCPSPGGIEVTAVTSAEGGLEFIYRARFRPDDIRIPLPLAPDPADGLWQHTCCEAFVAEVGDAYREFNFSPSGQWATYRFNAYRERDEHFIPTSTPQLRFTGRADGFELHASIPGALLPAGSSLYIGLTAVVEAADSTKSYWALAHASAQPDFHLRQSFSLTLNRNAP